MGIGKTNASGGGASLNFDIKAYSTEATLLEATPKENTIGIITTTAINGWEFSAVEPTEPVEGMVWITTGTSSAIEFNALKKNAIQVYPLSSKQYISGAWAEKPAKIYQGNQWQSFETVLLRNGVISDILGGFSLASNATFADGVLHTIYANNSYGIAIGQNNMDLTDFNTLHVMVRQTNATNALDVKVGIAQNANIDIDYIAYTQVTTETNGFEEYTVNIENVNSGHFKMSGVADAYTNEIWLT